MLEELTREYHLHPIVDHFTIALLTFGLAAEFLAASASLLSRGGWAGFVLGARSSGPLRFC